VAAQHDTMTSQIDPDPYFPWSHLGLRANPFQSLNRTDWHAIALLPEHLVRWLVRPSAILQLTGGKGTGKTSALLALRRELEKQYVPSKYEHLASGSRLPVLELSNDRLLLIDEAQRLTKRIRLKLFQSVQTKTKAGVTAPILIYSSHEDYSVEIGRYFEDFISYEMHALSARDLAGLLDRRVNHFAVRGSGKVHFDREAVDFLLAAFGADLRGMETFLYNFFQSIPVKPHIEAEILQEFSER
jgi:hypothetical protein